MLFLGDWPCIRRMPSYDLNVTNLWKLTVTIDNLPLVIWKKAFSWLPLFCAPYYSQSNHFPAVNINHPSSTSDISSPVFLLSAFHPHFFTLSPSHVPGTRHRLSLQPVQSSSSRWPIISSYPQAIPLQKTVPLLQNLPSHVEGRKERNGKREEGRRERKKEQGGRRVKERKSERKKGEGEEEAVRKEVKEREKGKGREKTGKRGSK